MNKKPFNGPPRSSARGKNIRSHQTKDMKSSRSAAPSRTTSAYHGKQSSLFRGTRTEEKSTRSTHVPGRNSRTAQDRSTRDMREPSLFSRGNSTQRASHPPRPMRDSYVARTTNHVTSFKPSSHQNLRSSHTMLPTQKEGKIAGYGKPTKVSRLKELATSTSWGSVASWYDDHLEKSGDTYHEKVIYPNLLRILGDIKGKKILDLACGQGQFSRLMRDQGAHVTGIDIGKELITIAESHNVSVKEAGTHKAIYVQGSADDLHMLKNETFDYVVCILALQNIENLKKTIEEAKRVLTPSGSFVVVLNHPSFRNPKQSYWGYDEHVGVQFRRVDQYMSESHHTIDMTPGRTNDKKFTVSFHRPLQVYVKALSKVGFALTRLEEWVSHKESEKGPRQKAENASRKEIPLFMCIEGKQIHL